MLSPFPRCRRRVLPSSCPGAVDGGGGVGDGFRAVGASGGLVVGAGGGTAVGAGGGTAVGASGGLAFGAGGGTAGWRSTPLHSTVKLILVELRICQLVLDGVDQLRAFVEWMEVELTWWTYLIGWLSRKVWLDVSQPFYDGFIDQVITRLGGSETISFI